MKAIIGQAMVLYTFNPKIWERQSQMDLYEFKTILGYTSRNKSRWWLPILLVLLVLGSYTP